jgi:hypothetical protein
MTLNTNMTFDGHENGDEGEHGGEGLRICPLVALKDGQIYLQLSIREPLFANVTTEGCARGGFRGQNSRLVNALRLLRIAVLLCSCSMFAVPRVDRAKSGST